MTIVAGKPYLVSDMYFNILALADRVNGNFLGREEISSFTSTPLFHEGSTITGDPGGGL